MNAQEYLNKFGVSIESAREFVFSNIGNPSVIYQVAKQFGITNAMLGEIAGNFSAAQIQSFFAASNIDSTDLDGETGSSTDVKEVLLNNYIDISLKGMNVSGFDTGAYRIVVDAANFPTYFDGQGVERVKSYIFNVSGFGADDSMVILNPGAVAVLPGLPDLNADVRVQAVGGVVNGQFDITLMGVLSSPNDMFYGYDGIAGFNRFPTGDISVVW